MPLDAREPTVHHRSNVTATRATLVALGLGALTFACKIDPERPVVHYSLSEDTQRVGDDGVPVIPGKVQAHIKGSLEMLFGTPSNPQLMLVEDWVDDGFDPNYPQYPDDDMGSGEFDDDMLDHLAAENAAAFARQLTLISEERYDEVTIPDHMLDLSEYWYDELLPEWQARDEEGAEFNAAEFKDSATYAFLDWYPTLRESAELYRVQCLHCHGPEGGGDGPTAEFLNPLPRDYRRGIFKFTSQKDKVTPSRHDLHQILVKGVTGTAMPSFRRFSDTELHGMVDYVRLLSMRGMVERDLATTYEFDEALPAEYVIESYTDVFEKWQHGTDTVVAYDGDVPAPTPESIALGKKLFEDASSGNCYSCHGMEGRGDGYAVYVTDPESETGALKVDKYDDWGHEILPRNIPQGIFRGGRRPIDIYRRIYSGINGTPMPALGGAKDADGNDLVTDDELWAIVHYVGWLSEQGPRAGAHRAGQDDDHGHADDHDGGHGDDSHGDEGHDDDEGHGEEH